jgi:hypothetical protein
MTPRLREHVAEPKEVLAHQRLGLLQRLRNIASVNALTLQRGMNKA